MQKRKITRPRFLVKLFSGEIRMDELKVIFPNHYEKIYGCYTLLKPYDFGWSDILAATVDAEDGSIALQLANKKFTKELKEKYHKSTTMVGSTKYMITVKIRGDSVVLNMTAMDEDESN